MDINAMKLAIEDINAAGGIKSLGGAKINPIVADATNDAQGAITTTERVLTQNKVSAAYGIAISPLTAAALSSFVKHHVPVLTTASADSLVTPSNGGFLFQLPATSSAYGKLEVEFLHYLNDKYKLGISKAIILYANNPAGFEVQKGIKSMAEQGGLEVVLDSPFSEGITDASPLVSKVQQSGAQVLFPHAMIEDAGLMLTALRSADSHVLVIGAGGGFVWPPIGKALGSKVNGVISAALWNFDSKYIKDDPALLAVTEHYMKAYGTFMPEQAGETYAAMWVLASAIDVAGSTDPAKVREALAKTDIKSGPAMLMGPGGITFGPNGASLHSTPVIIQWQGEIPRTVYPENLATAQVVKP
jgi:branched-chain amino acid transport system substrate-binding protein